MSNAYVVVPRRWPEHDLIEKEYARKGRDWLAKRTGRDPNTIHAYAKRHGLELGDLPNYVRISELARLTDQPGETVWQRANAEGVIRRLRADSEHRGTFAAVVPLAWADEYAAAHAARVHATRVAETEGWLSVDDLTWLWGVAKSTVLRNLNGSGALRPFLEGKRITRGLGPHLNGKWFVHPDDARTVAAHIEADRRKARSWVSTKSLAVEAGVKQAYAADIGKREFGGELLFVHGRLMCYVTPEAAEVMRRRFAEGITPGRRKGRPKKHPQPELKRAA